MAKKTEPQIVDRKPFTVIGMEYCGPMDNFEGIFSLWGSYVKRAGEIEPKTNNSTGFGVFYSTPDQADIGEVSYMACAPVTTKTRIPEGMDKWDVPGGQYAMFTHKGKLTDLPVSFKTLFKWIGSSPYEVMSAPGYELYGEHFNPSAPDCEIDIFIPVKKT